MTPLQRNFERWAEFNRWHDVLPLTKLDDGSYNNISTRIAFEAYVAGQADVIDMITKQDCVEAA